ncbi:hypothetical protein M569_04143 [Genlisea aurea]|uniref:Uncharacterized protein n=1 Tax=Genlisea aurea TaxID=192259 RepID=S8EDJ2_9LAMI|nr:hypothetical protein M569_04143 [Genlisea aurea]
MEENFGPSIKRRIKQSICFSCCFPRLQRISLSSEAIPSPSDENPTVNWINNGGGGGGLHDCSSFSEIRDKCRAILGCAVFSFKRRRHADLRYDPLSYALNFEDGFEYDGDSPLRNFSARMPPSPPVVAAAVS